MRYHLPGIFRRRRDARGFLGILHKGPILASNRLWTPRIDSHRPLVVRVYLLQLTALDFRSELVLPSLQWEYTRFRATGRVGMATLYYF